MAYINLVLPDELRDRFKEMCRRDGVTMQGVLLRAVEEVIAKGSVERVDEGEDDEGGVWGGLGK